MGVPRYDIAKQIGVSYATLTKYMLMARLVPAYTHRTPRLKTLPMARVIELYVCEQWSTHRIARFFGWSSTGIHQRLVKAGIQTRSRVRRPKTA